MDRLLRRATPVVLLAMAGLVWFERVLPGGEGFRRTLGDDAVLRFVTGVLCLYMLLWILERHRLERMFKEVLAAFRDFHGAGAAARGEAARGSERQDALRILVAALGSGDAEVRAKAAKHLGRMTGQDFGEDAERWRRWLDAEPR
jgi:hypothetical protein